MKVGDRVRIEGTIVGAHKDAPEQFTHSSRTVQIAADWTRLEVAIYSVEDTDTREVRLPRAAMVEVDLRP